MFSEETDVPPPSIFSFSTTVSLKIRSRSSKSNQSFVTSQLYIHKNLVRIQSLVHKFLCRRESVMHMPMPTMPPMRSIPKQYVSLPLGAGTSILFKPTIWYFMSFSTLFKSYQDNELGPVVQSIGSLTSSLRVISLTVLADSIHSILIFFAEKM